MTVSAITLPNVDAMVAAAHQSVENAVEGVRAAVKRTLLALTQPYGGVLVVPPAMGNIIIPQTGRDRGRRDEQVLRRALASSSSRGFQRKGLLGSSSAEVMGFCGEVATYTCSNHVEEATSASLTDSSSLTMWADDFSHEGI